MSAAARPADSGRSRLRSELRGEGPAAAAAPSRRPARAAEAGRAPGRLRGGAGVADWPASGPSAATAAARAREAERMPATLSASWEYSCRPGRQRLAEDICSSGYTRCTEVCADVRFVPACNTSVRALNTTTSSAAWRQQPGLACRNAATLPCSDSWAPCSWSTCKRRPAMDRFSRL